MEVRNRYRGFNGYFINHLAAKLITMHIRYQMLEPKLKMKPDGDDDEAFK